MIFGAYLGDASGASDWLRGVRAHAAWLGLEAQSGSEHLHGGAIFSYAWLLAKVRPAEPAVERLPGILGVRTGDGPSENSVSLKVALRSGELEIVVPPTTPEHFFVASRSGSHVVGNDLRLMIRWAGLELDPRGVYSILRFNASLPPFTVSRRVQRIPCGHAAKLAPGTAQPELAAACGDVIDPLRAGSIDSPAKDFLECLDGSLKTAPRDPVLFFSGGVDSALLASRLAANGRKDVRLLNLAFGSNDLEADHARRVASRLGLAFDQVTLTAAAITRVMEGLDRDYSFPFGDPSTIPTHVLVRSALARGAPSAVIEGTGADGAFGLGLKLAPWSRLYSLPHRAREVLGTAYAGAGLWKSGGRASRIARLARRSAALPLHFAAVLARNALHGIAYSVPKPVRDDVDGAIDRFLYGLSDGFEPRERLSLLDLMTVCAERFAPKSYDPLRQGGTFAIYPFLEPGMVRLSSSLTWEQKSAGGEKKGLLKHLLAQTLPHEMVYRKKSGFDPPFAQTFGSRPVQEYLHDVVLAADNPLRDFLHAGPVAEMIERSGSGACLDAETYEFLWTLCAASGWLRSLRVSAAPDF